MRRTIFLALFAALLIAPAARAASDTDKIQRDCADDSVLQGSYTVSQLREARDSLPTDADEYSDCRDVLSRAIAAKTTASKPDDTDNSGGGTAQSSGAGGGGGGDGSSSTTTPTPQSTSTPAPQSDPNAALVPSSPADNEALADAAKNGAKDVDLGAEEARIVPVKLSASVGRNGVPMTLIVLLALFAVAAVTVAGPATRRFVHARRKP